MKDILGVIGSTSFGICCAMLVIATQSSCPEPTKSINATQRKTPFFKILVYEYLESQTGATTVWLFEDEVGNCFISSGTDGGIQLAPVSSCAAAKAPTPVEEKK